MAITARRGGLAQSIVEFLIGDLAQAVVGRGRTGKLAAKPLVRRRRGLEFREDGSSVGSASAIARRIGDHHDHWLIATCTDGHVVFAWAPASLKSATVASRMEVVIAA